MRREQGRRHAVEGPQEFGHRLPGALGHLAGGVDLGPVAGRQHDRLAAAQPIAEQGERLGQRGLPEGHLLAQFNGRRVMADADQQQTHQ
jgi:hypothetical protein